MTIYDERGFALQATRQYEVHPIDFWLDDFNETVTLIKVCRNGKVKIGVTTNSAIVGVRIMKVKANAFTWKEVI
jgi:phage gp36-like protein